MRLNYHYFFPVVLFFFLFGVSCADKKFQRVLKQLPPDSVNSQTLSLHQQKVLDGAKKCLEAAFKYDIDMAYVELKYRDRDFIGNKVYPMGDLDPGMGVCTEVTIRALRWGGICDLQEKIHEDIVQNSSDYPVERWKNQKPDVNIDHRRVPNQLVWFRKNWNEVTAEKIMPGDIVIWDMNEDSWGDHIGIVSDKYEGSLLKIIHNFPNPGYVAEEDVLHEWTILGIFRVRE